MNWFKLLVHASLLTSFSAQAELPRQYQIKSYVKIKTVRQGQSYYHTYVFKDEKNELQTWSWGVPIYDNDSKTEMFGLPLSQVSGDQISIYDKDKNYFYLKNGYVKVDYSSYVNLYRDLAYPLYKKYRDHVLKNKLQGREQIEFLLRFLQDYPYGIVPSNFNNKFVSGVMPLSEVFKTGWSDCDSKSLLMASILSHDEFYQDKLAIITVPGHALLGIKGIPRPYEKYANYFGTKYIYAEPVGVVRTAFGRTNSPYTNSIEVYPIRIDKFNIKSRAVSDPNVDMNAIETLEIDNTQRVSESDNELKEKDCPDGGLLIKYDLPNGTKKHLCTIYVDGDIVNHGPAIIYSKNGEILERKNFRRGVEQ